ncbi:MAG: B12-binding domain-containing radical SAM protein, partial [Promethearchaeota archaeon]
YPLAMLLVKKIKNETRLPILMGGIHPTIARGSVFLECPEVDFVCVGEGESFVKDFLRAFENGNFNSVQNLIYRDGNRLVFNEMRSPEDLSKLPDFPWQNFRRVVVDDDRYIYVNATRGCPYKCAYCCNEVYLDLYGLEYIRHRPVSDVIEEMKKLKIIYNPKLFYFADEMPLACKEYAVELFEALRKHIEAPFGCMGRVEFLDEEMIDVLKKNNCRYVAIGVECGDEEYRKKTLQRYMSNDDIKRTFELCRRAGIKTCSFNMIGYPTENDDELCKATIALNRELKPDIIQVTWFYPFPGTRLYNYCKEKNLIDDAISLKSYHFGSILKLHKNKSLTALEYLNAF